jgi:MFS family permease
LSEPQPNFLHNAAGVLRNGPFRRYMIGETVSMTGTWMQMMAQSWVMTDLTASAFMLAVVNAAGGVPMLLLSMVGGSAADKHDKRAILMATQVVQIVLAVAVGYLVLTQKIQLWHLIVVAALLGVSNSFEMPAASALVPELVGKDQIKDAIALDRATFHATRLVGPAAAGVLIGALGAAMAFFANAFSFVALMIALMTLPAREKGTAEEEEKRSGGIKDGLDYVKSDRPTLAMIALMASTTLFIFPIMMVMMPIYVRDTLSLGAAAMGVMMSAGGIGSLTGSIGLLGVKHENRLSRLVLGSIGVAAGVGLLAIAHQMAVAAFGLVIMSLSLSTLIGLSNTIIMERTPVYLRGRVSAIVGISSFGLMPFAGLFVSAFADWVGMRWAIGTMAGLFAAVAAVVLLVAGKHANEAVVRAEEHRVEEAIGEGA